MDQKVLSGLTNISQICSNAINKHDIIELNTILTLPGFRNHQIYYFKCFFTYFSKAFLFETYFSAFIFLILLINKFFRRIMFSTAG